MSQFDITKLPQGPKGFVHDLGSDQRVFKGVPWGKAMMWIFLLSDTFIFSCFLILSECGIYKPVDTRKTPISGKERARKNVEEGRGISLKGLATGRGKTTYQFSTSNPMWRATLDILDFLPLSTVDYSGGVIISDWYSDQTNQNDSIKISVSPFDLI